MTVLPLALHHLPLAVHLRGAPAQLLLGVLVPLTGGEGLPFELEGEDTLVAEVGVAADWENILEISEEIF